MSDDGEFDEDAEPTDLKGRAKWRATFEKKKREITAIRNSIFVPGQRYPREAFGLKSTELPSPATTGEMIDQMKWANSGVHLISDIRVKEIPSAGHASWLSMRILDPKQFFMQFQKNAVSKHDVESKQGEAKGFNLLDDIMERRGAAGGGSVGEATQSEGPVKLFKPGPQEL